MGAVVGQPSGSPHKHAAQLQQQSKVSNNLNPPGFKCGMRGQRPIKDAHEVIRRAVNFTIFGAPIHRPNPQVAGVYLPSSTAGPIDVKGHNDPFRKVVAHVFQTFWNLLFKKAARIFQCRSPVQRPKSIDSVTKHESSTPFIWEKPCPQL